MTKRLYMYYVRYYYYENGVTLWHTEYVPTNTITNIKQINKTLTSLITKIIAPKFPLCKYKIHKYSGYIRKIRYLRKPKNPVARVDILGTKWQTSCKHANIYIEQVNLD